MVTINVNLSLEDLLIVIRAIKVAQMSWGQFAPLQCDADRADRVLARLQTSREENITYHKGAA